MSYISDFKSTAIGLFSQGTSNATGTGIVEPDLSTAVGQKFLTSDGREVALVQNGTVALVSGVLVQAPAIVANHQHLAVSVSTVSAAAGTNQISVTLGATLLTTNQYAGGYAVVDSGTGIGQTLRIASNPNSAASGSVVITLEDNIVTTLDATSTVCLIPNLYKNVIISPTTFTNAVVGVTLYPVAASVAPTTDGTTGKQTAAGTAQYAFIQTKGLVSCLSDATVAAVGLGITPSSTTAGCITVATATGTNIGRAVQTSVSAQARTIFVDL